MKLIKIGIMCILTLSAMACSSITERVGYTISDNELEQWIGNRFNAMQQKVSVAGVPINLQVIGVDVNIGPDAREVVAFDAQTKAEINVFGMSLPAGLSLKLEATPFYDDNEKALFLRDVLLLDSTIDAPGYRGNLAPLANQVLALLQSSFNDIPVYQLDKQDPLQRALMQIPLSLTVQQGHMRISKQ